VESGVDYLILPVDGADDHTYETNRYPAVFDEVESRIEFFLGLKHRLRSRLHVTVQMIRMRNNLDQIGTFRRKWRREGIDVVRVRDDLSGNYHEPPLHLRSAPRSRRPCFFLWRGPLFVQAAGTVIPCPYYHGTPPVGDLRHQTAREVWASEPMRKLRAAHVKGDLSQYPICKRCPRYQPHPLLGALSFFVTTWHIRRVFPVLENLQRRIGRKFFE
jgi:radical SAM protein with 4Fe4S-binding SPASM domain